MIMHRSWGSPPIDNNAILAPSTTTRKDDRDLHSTRLEDKLIHSYGCVHKCTSTSLKTSLPSWARSRSRSTFTRNNYPLDTGLHCGTQTLLRTSTTPRASRSAMLVIYVISLPTKYLSARVQGCTRLYKQTNLESDQFNRLRFIFGKFADSILVKL